MRLFVPGLRVASFVLLLGSILPAQAEVSTCKEITALPAIINTSGVWCLKKNLTSAATTGIAIDVQNALATIDLNGFTLTGSVAATTQAVGIHSLNRTNVTIRNGTIRGFSVGIFLEGASSNNVIEDMRLDQAQQFGIRAKQTVRAVIRNSFVTNTGSSSIAIARSILIETGKFTTVSNNIINSATANSHSVGILWITRIWPRFATIRY